MKSILVPLFLGFGMGQLVVEAMAHPDSSFMCGIGATGLGIVMAFHLLDIFEAANKR